MNNKNKLTDYVSTAMLISLCIVLPMAFHTIPNAGKVFAPMHIPVFVCGFICGPVYGLVCGLMGPVLSCLLTGMPTFAVLPQMAAECMVYGFVAGLIFRQLKSGRLMTKIYASLIPAMLAGRVIGGLLSAFIFSKGNYSLATWATGYFVVGLPGIAIQLIFVPMLVFVLIKATAFFGRENNTSKEKQF